MPESGDDLRQTFEALSARIDERARSADSIRALFAALHGELRGIARLHRRALHANTTLNTTGLVHEAYLKLSGARLGPIHDRAHFFALAAQTMRQIIIDRARRALADKRGDGATHVALDELALADSDESASRQALAVHQALDQLERHSARLAETVSLRFFAGMTEEEIADALDRDPSTVRRDWAKARAWLFRALSDPAPASP